MIQGYAPPKGYASYLQLRKGIDLARLKRLESSRFTPRF